MDKCDKSKKLLVAVGGMLEIMWILFLIVSLSLTEGAVYPSAYNLAAGKPVYIWPPGSTCNNSDYCESSTDHGRISYCNHILCQQSCDHKLPIGKTDILPSIQSGWGSCVSKDYTERHSKMWSANFTGNKTRDQCHLEIDPSHLSSVILMGNNPSLSLTFWIRPDVTQQSG